MHRQLKFSIVGILVGVLGAVAFLSMGGGDPTTTVRSSQADSKADNIALRWRGTDTQLDSCRGTDTGCLSEGYGRLAYDKGHKVALDRLEQHRQSNKQLQLNCHGIAHAIGSATMQKLKERVGSALSGAPMICGSGYLHGVLRELFLVTDAPMGAAARQLCDQMRTMDGVEPCGHGIGHGIMMQTDFDLPASLKVCDELHQLDAQHCYNGALMDNFHRAAQGERSWTKKDDLMYPCPTLADRYKQQCYWEVTGWARKHVSSHRAALQLCHTVETGHRQACNEGMARVIGHELRGRPLQVATVCRAAGSYEPTCIAQAAGAITSIVGNGLDAGKLCHAVASDVRSACFGQIGNVLDPRMTKRDLSAACRAIPKITATQIAYCEQRRSVL